ncbi:MAG: hypothetical protein CL431_09265 [Acidimicrobiaceae bacterium]|jgi:hypothetical protein|nr:hypothetical protein [Acidimicrobiaceae bacterium]|tara:strand:+ start:46187 stop:46453 length:267 start_codon:yes stop_codon:yes gene_type:complete
MKRDSSEITPLEIELKIKDIKNEILSISGGISIAQKIGPSAVTLFGMVLKGGLKRKKRKRNDPVIQIQLFPNIKKYFRSAIDESEIND